MLWGRSMGAATVLGFYEDYVYSKPEGEKFQGLKAIVADSPFTNFKETISNKVESTFFVGLFKDSIVRRLEAHVEEKLNIKISDIHLFKDDSDVNNIIPIVMIASKEDELTRYEVIERLSKRMKGPHKLITIKGNHNAVREPVVLQETLEYLLDQLGIPLVMFEGKFSRVDVEDIASIQHSNLFIRN